MRLIDADTAEQYLRESGRVGSDAQLWVRELTGGVSNVVLLVQQKDGPVSSSFVIKQVRSQLRVADPWFCSVERIWREIEVLTICEQVLEDRARSDTGFEVAIPRVQFVDRENYLFAMDAAPQHRVWKAQLLGGHTDSRIAVACGELMADLHGRTWQDAEIEARIGDRHFFDDLRIDPYYRQIARVHADLSSFVDGLIESLDEHRLSLVHGDFSPKNLLVFDKGLMLVDCEVGHFGDPAFDLGFFLTHLVLKAFAAGPNFSRYLKLTSDFWDAYLGRISAYVDDTDRANLFHRALMNLAGCALARVDGKSKVEYLGEESQSRVRRFCRDLVVNPHSTWSDVLVSARTAITKPSGKD